MNPMNQNENIDKNMNENIKPAFPETVTKFTDEIAKPYGKQIGEAIDNNINKFKQRFLEITGMKEISTDSLVDAIGDKLEDVTEVMDDPKFEQQLHKFLTVAKVPIVETIKTTSEIASESIGDVAEDSTHLIGNLIAEVPPFNIVVNSIFAAENAVKAARTSTEAINKIIDNVVETGNKIEDQLADTTGDLSGQVNNMRDDLSGQVNNITGDLSSQVKNITGDLSSQVNNITGDLSNKGQTLLQNASNGMEKTKDIAATQLSQKAFGNNYLANTVGKDYMKKQINNIPQIPQINVPVTGGSRKKQKFSTRIRNMRLKNMNTMKRIKNSVNKMLHNKTKRMRSKKRRTKRR
jgi:hypothetical protein